MSLAILCNSLQFFAILCNSLHILCNSGWILTTSISLLAVNKCSRIYNLKMMIFFKNFEPPYKCHFPRLLCLLDQIAMKKIFGSFSRKTAKKSQNAKNYHARVFGCKDARFYLNMIIFRHFFHHVQYMIKPSNFRQSFWKAPSCEKREEVHGNWILHAYFQQQISSYIQKTFPFF